MLKTYKSAKNERPDPYARWFLATRSPLTVGNYELGDGYAADVRRYGRLLYASNEWRAAYGADVERARGRLDLVDEPSRFCRSGRRTPRYAHREHLTPDEIDKP